MFPRQGKGAADQWRTQEVLKWIQNDDSSKGEIKSRVMSVVQSNDLDGHTLKQLAAEKEEIQYLFPALKDRLAFKSMLRKLFKDESPGLQTDPQDLPKQSPPAVPPGPHPQRLVARGHDLAAASPQFRNLNPAPTHFFHKDAMLLKSTQPAYREMEVSNHRPVEKRPRLSDNGQATRELPSAQQLKDLITLNTVPSIPYETNQSVKLTAQTRYQMDVNTNLPVYIPHPTIVRPPKMSHATQNATSTSIAQSATTSVNQSCSPVKFVAQTAAQSSLQISSVTSFAKADKPAQNPRPVRLTKSDPAQNNLTPEVIYPFPIPQPQVGLRLHKAHLDYPAPLPKFSDELKEMLRSCTHIISTSVRKRLIRESSQFYVNITMGQRLNCTDYANIGRTMVEEYPVLACDDGNLPWVSFNRNLSQSVRNLRRRLKKKNEDIVVIEDAEGGPPPLALHFGSFDLVEVSSDDDEDAVEDVIEGEEDVFLIKEEMPA